MNRLTFAVEPLEPDPSYRWVTPLIDGHDLAELVQPLGSVESLAGIVVDTSGTPLREVLLAGGATVAVLGCGCGITECGPLEADIRIGDTTVTWANFSPPADPRRVFQGFGPFVFELDAYRSAVEGLREA